MKKIFGLVVAFVFSIPCFALQPLTTYNDIKNAITTGDELHIILDFSRCTLGNASKVKPRKENIGIDDVAAFTPNEIVVDNDNNEIVASLQHFTLHDIRYPGQAVYEYNRYTLTPDEKISLTNTILDASTYKILSQGFSYTCSLGLGAMVYSA